MNKRTIKALKELQAQLSQTDSFEGSDRQLVEELQRDIHALLTGSEASDSTTRPHQGRLREAMQRFEVTHPELTAVMARVVDSLSNMGI